MNTKLLGRVQMSAFYLWLNKKPNTLADLKGLKMRTASLYDRLMRHYGIPVAMKKSSPRSSAASSMASVGRPA